MPSRRSTSLSVTRSSSRNTPRCLPEEKVEAGSEIEYEIHDGIFKTFCDNAGKPVGEKGRHRSGIGKNLTVWKVSLEGSGETTQEKSAWKTTIFVSDLTNTERTFLMLRILLNAVEAMFLTLFTTGCRLAISFFMLFGQNDRCHWSHYGGAGMAQRIPPL